MATVVIIIMLSRNIITGIYRYWVLWAFGRKCEYLVSTNKPTGATKV